eukprot:582135-Heterocapsa_arctica.AAC.1
MKRWGKTANEHAAKASPSIDGMAAAVRLKNRDDRHSVSGYEEEQGFDPCACTVVSVPMEC